MRVKHTNLIKKLLLGHHVFIILPPLVNVFLQS